MKQISAVLILLLAGLAAPVGAQSPGLIVDGSESCGPHSRPSESAGYRVGNEMIITLPGGVVTMTLTWIPAGTFLMGSPPNERGRLDREDLHEVTLTQGYWLGKYEVTQAQWEAVMGSPMSGSCGAFGIGPDFPVYCISWDEVCGGSSGADCAAESFIGRLNTSLGADGFRLPTEAEWERAARAGTQTPFSFGDDISCSVTSCSFCSLFDQYMVWCGNDNMRSEPVGTRLANDFGLYDMHGNQYEWVADWYTTHLGWDPVTDPTGPTSGSGRVTRGGYWYYVAQNCRAAFRHDHSPSQRYYDVGFRLASSPDLFIDDFESGTTAAWSNVVP